MSLLTLAFAITIALYTCAGAAFFVHVARGTRTSVIWASRALGAAIFAHGAYLAHDFVVSGRHPLSDIHQTLTLISLLIALAYLLTMRRHRLTSLGVFITPVTLLMFLGAGLRGSVPPVPEGVRSALLPLHVGVNVLGIVAFALAFAAAIAYLIQERLLRSKDVIGVFQRLPALDELDALGLKLVTAGFPLFTLGLVTGSVWIAKRSSGGLDLSAGQGFAMLAWLFFGSVLLARVAAGWSGRRAAIGTMLGFLCAVAALAGYALRGLGS